MNANLLINSINSNNSLERIAKLNNLELSNLKSILIEAIKQTHPYDETSAVEEAIVEEEISDSEYDTDNEEDSYDRIIRKSPVKFSDEQLEFLERCVKLKQNIALLAPAGYGKSKTIDTLVELLRATLKPYSDVYFRNKYGLRANVSELSDSELIGICSSTAKSAQLIQNARTLHSFLGIGLAKGNVDQWVERVSTRKYLAQTFNNLRSVRVIIIDEISMVSAELLDKISEYLKKVRKCSDPFGGVQLIFSGDLAQLAPVQGTFFFRSGQIKALDMKIFSLTKCFRQENDPTLLNILTELRMGHCSDESLRILNEQTSIDPEYSNGLQPTKIVSTNAEVDLINEQELNNIATQNNTEIVSFKLKPARDADTKRIEQCCKAENIPDEVKLTVGAMVMVTTNLTKTICNGTQGKVVSIMPNEVSIALIDKSQVVISYIPLKDNEHDDVYTSPTIASYMPLRLAWASTIHKIQGTTLQLLELHLAKVFGHGMVYVGISRVTSLKGLIVKGFTNPKKQVICHPHVKSYLGY